MTDLYSYLDRVARCSVCGHEHWLHDDDGPCAAWGDQPADETCICMAFKV